MMPPILPSELQSMGISRHPGEMQVPEKEEGFAPGRDQDGDAEKGGRSARTLTCREEEIGMLVQTTK